MNLHKRIGIIMGKVYKNINSQQLKGLLNQAYSLGFNANVFTLSEEYYDEQVTDGEKNLLNIINFSLLDGIIYFPYSFSSPEIKEYIEEFLKKRCPKPIIYAGIEPTPFINVWYDDKVQVAQIVRHLIDEHGCRKIYCLTGPENMVVAHNRLEGYKCAMAEAGLPFSNDDMIFGDFWFGSAQKLGRELIDGVRKMPDAVVCTNDSMAVALCDILTGSGISVPRDVRITGYDGTLDANIHVPSITTYQASWERLGAQAMSRLYEELTGKALDLSDIPDGNVLCGESCGCTFNIKTSRVAEFNYEKMEAGYMDSSLSTRLLAAKSFNSFIHELYCMTYFFSEPHIAEKLSYHLCLCDDWDKVSMDRYSRTYRTHGYSQRMIMTNIQQDQVYFALKEMKPRWLETDTPSVTFYVASHFRNRCFGYSLLTYYGVAEGFNIYFQRFCRDVNYALAFFSLQNDFKSIAYSSYIARSRDELTGLYLLDSSPQMWEETAELAQLYGEDIYIIAISAGGLRQVEDTSGGVEKNKILVAFADILTKSCANREKVFRVGDSQFAVIGSELSPCSHHIELVKRVTEQFKQQNLMLGNPHFLYIRHSVRIIPGTDICSAQEASEIIHNMFEGQSVEAQPSHLEQMHYSELVALRREIFKFPEKDWNLSCCCQRLNISKSHFQKIYRSTFDVNCMHDIQQSKLNHAKKLLVMTNDTLQDIAAKCGYDYSHFMRIFKKEVGMTPTQYRRGTANKM